MSNRSLQLTVAEETDGKTVTRSMSLDGKTIFFKIRGDVLPPPLRVWDFAVVASVFTAMRTGRSLYVDGPVSRSLLRNLEEFQEAWSLWQPRRYRSVPISARDEVDNHASPRRTGAFAFSGGVDAAYSLLRHVRNEAGRRTVTPVVAVLVKGFDIGLNDDSALAVAESNARAMVDSLDVSLTVVETNWKTDLCYDWILEHMAGLVACLGQFGGLVDTLVVGSDEAYTDDEKGWGSNSITNPLLSSDSASVRTEGLGLNRSERLEYIARNSGLGPRLRVCWENAHTGTNCGRCEKCIRTQLNFRAIGAQPEGFSSTAGFLRIVMGSGGSRGYNQYLREILVTADRNDVSGAWRVACRLAVLKNTLLAPYYGAISAAKSQVRRNEALYGFARRLVGRHG